MTEENQATCNCFGCQAHTQIMGFQNLSYDRAKEIEALKEDQITYHGEETLGKVYTVLKNMGLDDQQTIDAVNEMQNAGIYFRERQPHGDAGIHQEAPSG